MTFFRKLFYWLSTLWLGWRCRCPKCRQGAMFASYYYINKKCPNCQVVFQPYAGDALGVYAVAYFLSVIPALIAFILAFKYTAMGGYGLVLVFSGVSAAVLFGLFPNMKGLWVALVYLATGLKKRL